MKHTNRTLELTIRKNADGSTRVIERQMLSYKTPDSDDDSVPGMKVGEPFVIAAKGMRPGLSTAARNLYIQQIKDQIPSDSKILVLTDVSYEDWSRVVETLENVNLDTVDSFLGYYPGDRYPNENLYSAILVDTVTSDMEHLKALSARMRQCEVPKLIAFVLKPAPVNPAYYDVIANIDSPWKAVTPTGKF